MRGFVVGSLALIVLYVVVQPGTADKAATGGNVLVSLLRRALSPQVAGIPNHGGAYAASTGQAAAQAAATTKVGQTGQAVGQFLNTLPSN
jgi:hypothetical protein